MNLSQKDLRILEKEFEGFSFEIHTDILGVYITMKNNEYGCWKSGFVKRPYSIDEVREELAKLRDSLS